MNRVTVRRRVRYAAKLGFIPVRSLHTPSIWTNSFGPWVRGRAAWDTKR